MEAVTRQVGGRFRPQLVGVAPHTPRTFPAGFWAADKGLDSPARRAVCKGFRCFWGNIFVGHYPGRSSWYGASPDAAGRSPAQRGISRRCGAGDACAGSSAHARMSKQNSTSGPMKLAAAVSDGCVECGGRRRLHGVVGQAAHVRASPVPPVLHAYTLPRQRDATTC